MPEECITEQRYKASLLYISKCNRLKACRHLLLTIEQAAIYRLPQLHENNSHIFMHWHSYHLPVYQEAYIINYGILQVRAFKLLSC